MSRTGRDGDRATVTERGSRKPWGRLIGTVVAVAAAGGAIAVLIASSPAGAGSPASSSGNGLASNANLDPGSTLSGKAPGFTLTDQFGRHVSLRSFRGKVVLLAFNDPQCTTVCPLTTTAMVEAKALLGKAASQVQLLGISANPKATGVRWVRAYSRAHGMLDRWHFLTGSTAELRRIWNAYGIGVEIERGNIDHTPALYAIDRRGRLRKLYMTQMAYSSVPQLAELLAHEAASLLPGHPHVRAGVSYAPIKPLTPHAEVSLPQAGGGSARLGPGRARLMFFFATWDSEVVNLTAQLEALGRYDSTAAARGLPGVTAVDEAGVEPSPAALPRLLGGLSRPPSYAVAIDRRGRLADGYEVQGLPWLALVSPSGQILWHHEGWLGSAALRRQVRAALAHPPKVKVPSTKAAPQVLADSPAPLAALHEQAGQLLGSGQALEARLKALRGYPVVLNAWASWCPPCQKEFPLFASASVRYGRRVAFVGADTEDSAESARPFLSEHPISYPSYQTTLEQLSFLTPVRGLPTTIFIGPEGKVVHVHIGQYDAEGSLDLDIRTYAAQG